MASESPLSLIAISLRERLLTLVRRTDSEDPLHPRQKPASLVYDVDDRPPLLVQLGVSIQHLFLMFTSWIYVVVIVNSVGGTAFQALQLSSSRRRGFWGAVTFVLFHAALRICHLPFWPQMRADFPCCSEWWLLLEQSPDFCPG
jgi:hypothetical protein